MSLAAKRGAPGTRRREIEKRLAGLRTQGAAFPREVGAEPGAFPLLTTALRDLGPAFIACGLDLSTRRDLLPPPLCRALAALAENPRGPGLDRLDGRPELPSGSPITEVEARPETLCAATSLHRARLCPGGESVRILLPRPDFAAASDRDIDHLSLLLPLLERLAPRASRERLSLALAEATSRLGRAMELGIAASAQSMLALDAKHNRHLAPPPLLPELSKQHHLVFADIGQRGLEGWLDRLPPGIPAFEDLAHRLCRAWIRQVLRGRLFPLEPRPEHLEVEITGKILFRGGAFVWPKAQRQDLLRDYLQAALAADPDAGLEALCREAEPPGADLRRRFRLCLPETEIPGAGAGLGEELLMHWRLLAEAGRDPGEEIRAFFHGLVELQRTARKLAPDRDSFRQALEQELSPGGEGFAEALDPRIWIRHLEPYGELLATLPTRLEEAAASLAEGRAGIRIEVAESPQQRAATKLGAIWVLPPLLLLLASLLLAGGAGGPPPWLDAVVIAALAVFVGWRAGRGGGT